ncbi:ABC transporter ATP-binding protein [Mycoplasmoides fastidiosum]|nr:ABC transporter ATP-binding protein [Mycoplasmoides fastidiosum]UUD37636.1 ABC transporter ATP-binding protein [Mycoplasmoides fastidiosum]
MNRCLKFVDSNRQKLRNDRPFKYWALNQDVFINITVVLWLIWQSWTLSVILPKPTVIDEHGLFNFYLQSVFWKLGNLENALALNADVVAVQFLVQAYIFIAFTIILFLLTIYTVVVTFKYIDEIKKATTKNNIKTWHRKITFFQIFVFCLVVYGTSMFGWLLFGMFYIPLAQASQGFETLVFIIPPKNDLQTVPINFNQTGLALIVSNSVNLFLLVSMYLFYIRQRFIGYRYFFSFEKKEWKRIDYVGETMSFKEQYQLIKANKPHKGSINAVNNEGYIIEIKNVNKYFISNGLKLHALKDINLRIKQGEFVVILGPSGSGKTTLLNIISGVDRPTDGEIVVANKNIIRMKPEALTKYRREKTGYIFQQYSLLPNLTVRENVMIGSYLAKARNKKISKIQGKKKFSLNLSKGLRIQTAKDSFVDEILKLLDLEIHANKYPSQLSGGQQQRVAIARSFVKHPDILFGDEPTGAIDVEMSKQILELFYLINTLAKTTVLMVTHNPLIAEMATRVIVVSNGKIVRNQINLKPKRVNEIDWN